MFEKILPEEVSLPNRQNVETQTIDLDILKRENRAHYKSPPPDNVKIVPLAPDEIQPGADLSVKFNAQYQMGDTLFVELWSKELNKRSAKQTQDTDGSLTFTNMSKEDAFVVGYIVNNKNIRVSNLNRLPITVGDGAPHDKLPSFADKEGGYEENLIQIDRKELQREAFEQEAAVHLELFRQVHSKIQDIEEHIHGMVGLGYTAMTEQDFHEAATIDVSEPFYPTTWTEDYPKLKPRSLSGRFPQAQGSDVMSGDYDIRDDAERGELLDVQDKYSPPGGTGQFEYPTSVYDVSREENVSYGSDAEVQERIDEIDALITGGTLQDGSSTDGFNNTPEVKENHRDRYIWLNQYANHFNGSKFRANQAQRAKDFFRTENNMSEASGERVGF